jgi:hypothetical protein
MKRQSSANLSNATILPSTASAAVKSYQITSIKKRRLEDALRVPLGSNSVGPRSQFEV